MSHHVFFFFLRSKTKRFAKTNMSTEYMTDAMMTISLQNIHDELRQFDSIASVSHIFVCSEAAGRSILIPYSATATELRRSFQIAGLQLQHATKQRPTPTLGRARRFEDGEAQTQAPRYIHVGLEPSARKGVSTRVGKQNIEAIRSPTHPQDMLQSMLYAV